MLPHRGESANSSWSSRVVRSHAQAASSLRELAKGDAFLRLGLPPGLLRNPPPQDLPLRAVQEPQAEATVRRAKLTEARDLRATDSRFSAAALTIRSTSDSIHVIGASIRRRGFASDASMALSFAEQHPVCGKSGRCRGGYLFRLAEMTQSKTHRIRTAIAGVGNCASALIQGLHLYRTRGIDPAHDAVKPVFAGFNLTDIEVVAAFDVHPAKVGLDLADAVLAPPNCANKVAELPHCGVNVTEGIMLDPQTISAGGATEESRSRTIVDIAATLTEKNVDVLVNLLPSGAIASTSAYVHAATRSRTGIINAIPVAIANDPAMLQLVTRAEVPLIGDDIKSQFGATVIHKCLLELLALRGAKVDQTIQLDWGGDQDFENLVRRNQYRKGKSRSKSEPLLRSMPSGHSAGLHVAAVDYIPFLGNMKEAIFRIQGRVFGDQEFQLDMSLKVQDAYNSVGVLIDAIRVAKWALDSGRAGLVEEAAAVFCKWTPHYLNEFHAYESLVRLLSPARTARRSRLRGSSPGGESDVHV